mgnify:CR=1 FL=1|jgi:hypothetical protein
MGGAVKGLPKDGLVTPVSATKKSDKPDLNVEAGGKPTGPKADFPPTSLGERKKKPAITLLGTQP